MSKLEDRFESFLIENNIKYEKQKEIPVNVPWSKRKSKCDFHLIDIDLYIEVKGFMTLESMFKIYYLMSQKSINYILLQMTEGVSLFMEEDLSVKENVKINIDRQFEGILNIYNGKRTIEDIQYASMMSLQGFVGFWILKYREFNLNLLDFQDILNEVDPNCDKYCESRSKFEYPWILNYPEKSKNL